jgi:hypothetical protein
MCRYGTTVSIPICGEEIIYQLSTDMKLLLIVSCMVVAITFSSATARSNKDISLEVTDQWEENSMDMNDPPPMPYVIHDTHEELEEALRLHEILHTRIESMYTHFNVPDVVVEDLLYSLGAKICLIDDLLYDETGIYNVYILNNSRFLIETMKIESEEAQLLFNEYMDRVLN